MALNDRAIPPSEAWVGRPRKKRKRSKHKDEPFVKDGKLSRKGRTIACQSCRNTRLNKATCKGQVGQDGSGGSGVGVVIGLSAAAAGHGGAGGPGGEVLAVKVHPILDGQREEYKHNKLVHKKNSHSTCKSTFYQFSSASE
ncbi:hypothetical protein Tco_0853387 [Tanacetum coccineum]